MAPLPKPTPSTIAAIDQHYVDSCEDWDSLGISVSIAGTECHRALWYELRWASQPEPATGKRQRLFERGQDDEDKMLRDLRAIGVEVWGEQEKARAVHGFVRGKLDGIALGLLEAPKTTHVVECKSVNTKGFNAIIKDKVKKAKPLHHAQIQLYMHILGLDRGFYYVKCADTQEYWAERVEYDVEYCLRLLANLERIIFSDAPPGKLSDDPEFFKCRFCKHHAVCHRQEMPRVSCRTCIHFQPERGGDCHVSCARWAKPLGVNEQRAACPAHLFNPNMIDGEQIDFDEENEVIVYRMRDGVVWRDGETRE
ncbi:oxidoreductase [Sinorhizobium meliloti]|uniref:oxidoreductase n=1 Tax=Rhizobium meliloti TaxID=382 RepID=UPI000FD1B24B|nr:oxidoreductase [Sinorhizobium meliloti]RVO41335.1 oxidoreductase [Sinorhizobium meliloti]